MKAAVAFFIFCFVCLQLQAQDSSLLKKYPRNYSAVKIGTGELIVYDPMVQFAFERRKNLIGVQLGTGFCIPKHYTIDDSIKGKSYGFTFRAEGRLYKPKKRRYPTLEPYAALELYYKYYELPSTGWFVDSSTPSSIHTPYTKYQDSYLLRKASYCFAGKLGVQQRFLKHFLAEFSMGIGLKLMKTTQRGRTNAKDSPQSGPDFNVRSLDNELGKVEFVALPINLSIGYFFK